jgi:hypothetical protein
MPCSRATFRRRSFGQARLWYSFIQKKSQRADMNDPPGAAKFEFDEALFLI